MAKNKPVGDLTKRNLQAPARVVDVYAGAPNITPNSSAGEIAESLGVVADVFEKETKKKEEEDLRLVDFYADQFIKDNEAGMADKVAVGEVYPEKSDVIKGRITESIGKKYAEKLARISASEILSNENLLYDIDARLEFQREKRSELSELIKDRPFFGAGALAAQESVFREFENQFQQIAAKKHIEDLSDLYSSKLGNSLLESQNNNTPFDLQAFEKNNPASGLSSSTKKDLAIDAMGAHLIKKMRAINLDTFQQSTATLNNFKKELDSLIPPKLRGDAETEFKINDINRQLQQALQAKISNRSSDRLLRKQQENSNNLQKIKKLRDDNKNNPVNFKMLQETDYGTLNLGNEMVYDPSIANYVQKLQNDQVNEAASFIRFTEYRDKLQRAGKDGNKNEINAILNEAQADSGLNLNDTNKLLDSKDKAVEYYTLLQKPGIQTIIKQSEDFVTNTISDLETSILTKISAPTYINFANQLKEAPAAFAVNTLNEKIIQSIESFLFENPNERLSEKKLTEIAKKHAEEVKDELNKEFPIIFNFAVFKQIFTSTGFDSETGANVRIDKPTTQKERTEAIKEAREQTTPEEIPR